MPTVLNLDTTSKSELPANIFFEFVDAEGRPVSVKTPSGAAIYAATFGVEGFSGRKATVHNTNTLKVTLARELVSQVNAKRWELRVAAPGSPSSIWVNGTFAIARRQTGGNATDTPQQITVRVGPLTNSGTRVVSSVAYQGPLVGQPVSFNATIVGLPASANPSVGVSKLPNNTFDLEFSVPVGSVQDYWTVSPSGTLLLGGINPFSTPDRLHRINLSGIGASDTEYTALSITATLLNYDGVLLAVSPPTITYESGQSTEAYISLEGNKVTFKGIEGARWAVRGQLLSVASTIGVLLNAVDGYGYGYGYGGEYGGEYGSDGAFVGIGNSNLI